MAPHTCTSFASTTGTTSDGKHVPYVPRWRATAVATYRPTPAWAFTLAGRALLHSLPIGYALDDARCIRDPRGMFAEKLGVDMHVVTAAAGAVKNLTTCVARCHLDTAAVVVSPYASGLSSLAAGMSPAATAARTAHPARASPTPGRRWQRVEQNPQTPGARTPGRICRLPSCCSHMLSRTMPCTLRERVKCRFTFALKFARNIPSPCLGVNLLDGFAICRTLPVLIWSGQWT